MSSLAHDYDSRILLKARLNTGREIDCDKYLVSYTYDGYMIGRMDEAIEWMRQALTDKNLGMRHALRHEALALFGNWPLHVIEPERPEGEMDYPRVRFTGFFSSLPIREKDLSSLVVAWFQHEQYPALVEPARSALQAIDWEGLALDHEI
jgi:hypothetical protein